MEYQIVLKNQARDTYLKKTTETLEAHQTVTFALHVAVLSILQENVRNTHNRIHHTLDALIAV